MGSDKLGGIHLLRSQNFWDYGPPLVRSFTQPISSVVRKIGHFFHPPPPLGANVINGSPLTMISRYKRTRLYSGDMNMDEADVNLKTIIGPVYCDSEKREIQSKATASWIRESNLSMSS